jgi:transcriptional regulator GlxA family with amidase domain
MNNSIKVIRIGMLVYPGCLRSSAVLPLDVFSIANRLGFHRAGTQPVEIQSHWVSARAEHSVLVEGLSFPTQPLSENETTLDALMLPGIDYRNLDELSSRLARMEPEQAAIRSFAATGKLLVSSCSSTCLVATTGLLDGRRATTSWWLSSYFRTRFPKVILDADQLVVRDGPHISSGGVTSSLDLALWLVGHFAGEQLRQNTAKVLVIDGHRASQAPFVADAMIQSDGHAIIERARRWINQRLDQDWSMAELAQYCHTSQRTLLRRFHAVLGVNPTQYTQQLRVERAKALLESTRLSLEAVTSRCGYEDVSTFSKVFKRWAQVSPREYRSRFSLRH